MTTYIFSNLERLHFRHRTNLYLNKHETECIRILHREQQIFIPMYVQMYGKGTYKHIPVHICMLLSCILSLIGTYVMYYVVRTARSLSLFPSVFPPLYVMYSTFNAMMKRNFRVVSQVKEQQQQQEEEQQQQQQQLYYVKTAIARGENHFPRLPCHQMPTTASVEADQT